MENLQFEDIPQSILDVPVEVSASLLEWVFYIAVFVFLVFWGWRQLK